MSTASVAIRQPIGSSLRAQLAIYNAFIRNAFLAMLAYRMRYYTGIITYLLFVTVNYFIWKAVFGDRPADFEIHGFTFPEMVTYISIGWLSRSFYFSDIDYDIDELVRSGQVSMYLLRPVNFQLMMYSQAFGGILFRGLFFSVPIALVLFWIYPIIGPAGFGNALWFSFSTFMAFVVMAELNFLVGLLAFSFKSIEGVIRAKYYLFQLGSGLLLPLAFFPDWLRKVLELLPFKIISYVPLQFYLGHVSPEAVLGVLAHQLSWAFVLALIGYWMWHRVLAKLTIQGG